MDKRFARIAKDLRATHVGKWPEVGGGAFGMARLVRLLCARFAKRQAMSDIADSTSDGDSTYNASRRN